MQPVLRQLNAYVPKSNSTALNDFDDIPHSVIDSTDRHIVRPFLIDGKILLW